MISVPLRSRRRKRAQVAQKFQHIIPAIPLLFGALSTMARDPHGLSLVIALFAMVTSVLLLATTVREIRALRRPSSSGHAAHAHGIAWFDVFASAVLVAEAWEHWHHTHHWQRPVLLSAAVALALGLFHGRIESWADDKRALKVSDEGISLGGRPFGVFRAKWDDVDAIDVGGSYATIRTRSGRTRRINLQDCEDQPSVRAALLEAQSRVVPRPS